MTATRFRRSESGEGETEREREEKLSSCGRYECKQRCGEIERNMYNA